MGDADYTALEGTQLTWDGQRTGGAFCPVGLLAPRGGGAHCFFWGFFISVRASIYLSFFSSVTFFFFFIFSTDSMYSPSMSCVWSVRCMEWKETGFGPCVDLHKPKQHHGALEQ